jgi:eukaryotic-like serine/threonine-protein kinase
LYPSGLRAIEPVEVLTVKSTMRRTIPKSKLEIERLSQSVRKTFDNSDPLIGRVIDNRYKLESLMGEGGMGSVYCARRHHIGDLVAIKVLKINEDLDPVDLRRFQLEASSAASIKHQCVISIYDFGLLDDIAYLVMERLEGPSLSNEIKYGRISLERAIRIFKQVAGAVSAANQQGIVHRDLKPNNIIFKYAGCEEDLIKVVDFGIAKIIRANGEEKLTDAGFTMGTPAYMSPEQSLGQRVSEQSDIYSLGILLYEMLTSRVPFHDYNASAILIQHATKAPPSMLESHPDIPEQVDAVVMKALEKIPEKRYRSALEMATEFELACRNAALADNFETSFMKNGGLFDPQTDSSIAKLPFIEFSTHRPALNLNSDEDETSITSEERKLSTKVLEPLRFSFERFIGRREELGQIEERFEQAKSGIARSLFVIGDPGVGKTELINQFQRRLNPAEALFLMGKFYEYGSDNPYRPYLDSLYSFVRTFQDYSPEGWVRTNESGLTAKVKRGLDDIDSLINFRHKTGTIEEQIKYRAFELITKSFITISKSFPLILFLDDLQWADPLSLEFLSYFIRNTEQSRIMVLCTARAQDLLDDERPIKSWLRRVCRYKGYDQIRLKPLCEMEVRAYIDTVFGNIKISEGVIRRFYEVTQGNPFYLGEIVHKLIQEQSIKWMGDRWQCAEMEDIELPGSILDLVELRLNRLTRETLDVFTRAAVVGEKFSLQLLQAITDLPKDELMDIIDFGLRELIIKESTPFIKDSNSIEALADDYFIFSHSTLRKVLYEQLSNGRRRWLHAQIARKFEILCSRKLDRVAGELAYHFYHGSIYHKSLYYGVSAGESSRNIFAIDEALKYFTWADESCQKMMEVWEEPEYGTEWMGNFRLSYGNVLMHLSRNDAAHEQFEMSLKLSQEANILPLQAKVMQGMGELSWSRGQYDEALGFYKSGLEIVAQTGDVGRECRLYGVIGDTYFSRGNYDQAIEVFNRSLDLARQVGDSSSEGEALRRLGAIMGLRKQTINALEYLEKSLDIARAIGNRQSEWLVMMIIGNVYLNQSEVKQAADYYRQSLAIARAIGRRRGEGRVTISIGEVFRKSGDFNKAKIYYNDALTIAIDVQDREIEGNALLNLGLVYEQLSEFDRALESFQEALNILNATQHHTNLEVATLSGMARILLHKDELIDAKRYFEIAISMGCDLGLKDRIIPNLQSLAVCERKLGRIDVAKECLAEALSVTKALMTSKLSDQEHQRYLQIENDILEEITSLQEPEATGIPCTTQRL